MIIRLYKNIAEKNSVVKYSDSSSKELTPTFSVEGYLKNGTSIIDPIIIIEDNTSAIRQVNYAYIPDFNRYYFINDIASTVNNLWEVHMHCDVLSSFWSEIKTNTAIIGRCQASTFQNPNIDDSEAIIETFPSTSIIEGDTLYTNSDISTILVAAGGTSKAPEVVVGNPYSVEVTRGESFYFACGSDAASYLWMYKKLPYTSSNIFGDNTGWTELSDSEQGISGATTNKVTISSTWALYDVADGIAFRCKVTRNGLTDYTRPAYVHFNN